MSKHCQIFQSPYKPSQASMLFPTTYLPLSEFRDPCDCGQISENIFFLNLIKQKIFFDKNYWFQLLSTKIDWIISLLLISITLHSLSLGHSIMSSFCWQKNNLWLSMKTLSLLLTLREKVLFLVLVSLFVSFFSFSFFGLLRPLLQICKVWLIQTPARCTNQVTLSNRDMNYLFRV